MTIRRAADRDTRDILRIYEAARAFMRAAGNTVQWTDGYPSGEIVQADMARGVLYVCENADARIYAAFALIPGEDPTYAYIEGGAWRDGSPYATIHRVRRFTVRRATVRSAASFATSSRSPARDTTICARTHTRITCRCSAVLRAADLSSAARSMCVTGRRALPTNG